MKSRSECVPAETPSLCTWCFNELLMTHLAGFENEHLWWIALHDCITCAHCKHACYQCHHNQNNSCITANDICAAEAQWRKGSCAAHSIIARLTRPVRNSEQPRGPPSQLAWIMMTRAMITNQLDEYGVITDILAASQVVRVMAQVLASYDAFWKNVNNVSGDP